MSEPTQINYEPLFRAVCQGTNEEFTQKFKEISAQPNFDVNVKDKHKNGLLHHAIYQKKRQVVKFLLEKGADPLSKAAGGWSPVMQSLATGSKDIVREVYTAFQSVLYKDYGTKIPQAVKTLGSMPDFYMELKWEFKSWIPFVSHFCPCDTYSIWKRGNCFRVDTQLIGFENMRWLRGKISILLKTEDDGTVDGLYIVDHIQKKYDKVMGIKPKQHSVTEHELEELMHQQLMHARAHTKEITISPSKTWRGYHKTGSVGDFGAKLYAVDGLVYHVQQRVCTLQSDVKESSQRVKINNSKGDDLTGWDFDEYMAKGTDNEVPLLYKNESVQLRDKKFKGTVFLTDEFPRTLDDILPIFECLSPTQKHFKKVADFIKLLPDDGLFPVKLEVPVFPTVFAVVQFLNYEERDNIDASLFDLPEDYVRERKKKLKSIL